MFMKYSQLYGRLLARLVVGLAAGALLASAQDATGGLRPILPDWLDLRIDLRSRSELRTNFNNQEDRDDAVDWTRLRLNVGVTPTDWLQLTFQGQDARLLGRADWRGPSENQFDVRQAYVSLGRSDGSQLHVGRQQLRYGDDRLIGRRNWSNVDPTWDASRVVLRRGDDQVDIFSMAFVGTDPDGFDRPFRGDRMHGFYGRIGSLIDGATIEPYVLYSSQPRVSGRQDGGPDSGSYTTGVRFAGSATQWVGYDFEVTSQRGHAREVELRGWASAASVTVGNDALPLKSRFRVLHDYASGDDSRETDRQTVFDPLHHARHKHLGIVDVVGRRNTSAITIGWAARLHPKLRLGVNHLEFWLASRYDGLYGINGATAVAAPAAGAPSRRVGSEWDVRLTYTTPISGLTLDGGVGVFSAGEFLKSTTEGDSNRKLVYLAFVFQL
jgi:hypothetical protein